VEVSRPAHVFVLLLKTAVEAAVEAKILLSLIQGLFDCLALYTQAGESGLSWPTEYNCDRYVLGVR
jgi:hypothetical protein